MPEILVLDFDGVLSDSQLECLLITWNSHYGRSTADFNDKALTALPASFVERFTAYRGYARHLGHFFVSLIDELPPVLTQREFETIYASLAHGDVLDFIRKASDYRNQVRLAQSEIWLSYHRLYPGMGASVRAATARQSVYIVSAKDASSVLSVLQQANITFTRDHIFGEQRSKLGALHAISARERIDAAKLVFFDDSVFNVLEAKQAGYNASWALWGYHALEHVPFAQEQHIPAIDLETFLRRYPGQNGHVFSHQ